MIRFLICSLAAISLAPQHGWSEEKKAFLSSERRAFTAPELTDAPDEWISRSLAWIDDILGRFQPGLPETPVRRAALIRLDDILHLESAPKKPIVQDYFRARMERVIAEIETTRVTGGIRIWKLYNHGFLVRTASVSFVFDLVPGPPRMDGFRISPEWMTRLVSQADAAFISHLHYDHANQEVAKIFLSQGKPVVAPEGLWKDQPELAAKLFYPVRDTQARQLELGHGKKALEIIAFPGHQGAPVLNNVHLVKTPEGFTVMQTGDQSNMTDFDWIAHVGDRRTVDVLMPNCWSPDLQRMLRGINPRLVITGHENEMAHTVDHREDYTQTYNHMADSPYPFVLMTWGESYHVGR